MASTKVVVICLCLLVAVLSAEAQREGREGRRRGGRRKTTTESPPPPEDPEKEVDPQKIDAEPEALAKPVSIQPPEEDTNTSLAAKDTTKDNQQGGPPFIVPRGSRRPRPMRVNNAQGRMRPKPTLPTFSRKSSRTPKTEPKKMEEGVSTTSTSKPSRSHRRRNNQHKETQKVNTQRNPEETVDKSDAPTDSAPKKRFGGSRRNRGGRRSTTLAPEE